MSSMIPRTPHILNQFVYTKMSLKSELWAQLSRGLVPGRAHLGGADHCPHQPAANTPMMRIQNARTKS